MENSEAFKSAAATIKALEEKQTLCVDLYKSCSIFAEKAEKEIEDHFKKLIHLLAARKATLLRELSQVVESQEKRLETTRRQIEESIEGSKQTLKGAAMMYLLNRDLAENIWKELNKTSVPQVDLIKLSVEFPGIIMQAIQTHGKVLDNRFSTVDKITTFAGMISNRGCKDGFRASAMFNRISGVCFNPIDNCLYVCDYFTNSIRKITFQGEVSTLIAKGLNWPIDIAFYQKENIMFISNTVGHTILKLTSGGGMF